MKTSIMLLKLWYIKLRKISAFCLIIFVGMLFSCEDLETFISFMASSFVIWLKVKTKTLLVFSFIANIDLLVNI